MLANFKRTIQVSVLLSALAASAVGAVGVAGIAYAVPNFERVFESPYSQLLLAHKSATPASGNYDNAVQPVKISMQNEGAFTNVMPQVFRMQREMSYAQRKVGPNSGAPHSVLQVIAVHIGPL